MRYFRALKGLHNVTLYRLCKQSTGNNSALARLSLRLVAAARLMLLFLHASLDWHAIAFRGTSREARTRSPLGSAPASTSRTAPFPLLEDLGFCCFGTWRHLAPAGRRPRSSRKLHAETFWGGRRRRRRACAVHLCTVIFAIHPRLYTCGEINSDNRRGRHISVVFTTHRDGKKDEGLSRGKSTTSVCVNIIVATGTRFTRQTSSYMHTAILRLEDVITARNMEFFSIFFLLRRQGSTNLSVLS